METDDGSPRPTTAANLAELLTITPRLLFVSACLTATSVSADHLPPGNGHKADSANAADITPDTSQVTDWDLKGGTENGGGPVAHSLATALIKAGIPSVLGWDGSVNDRAATLFAEHVYGALANQADLAVAVGDARRTLLNSDDPHLKADWHLARLWLGPEGGGPVVTGTRKRFLVTATQATKKFLKRKQQLVPVASPAMFVGRRSELQQSLRALRSGDWSGALLHGQGRLGKSSLAARLADRLSDYATPVVFGDYSALGILDAIADEITANPEARELIKRRRPEVRQDPREIESVLIDLLTGPCAQTGKNGQRPLLLIIDDLEQILISDPNGPYRVATDTDSDQPQILSAVLRAFDLSQTDSRLLVTSRYTFTLNGLESTLADIQLRPLADVAQHKLQRRQQSVTRISLQAERAALATRALEVSRGNPGLQDLIGLRLVYGEQVSLNRAEAAVAGMESYLRQGDLPAEPELRSFLENLALDTLLAEAGPASRDLLRATTVFDLPVPEQVIDALVAETGGSVTRLRGLGLLDPYSDLYAPSRQALAPSSLAAGRLAPLTADERLALATLATEPLFSAWGGAAGRYKRDPVLDLQLTRLAMLADATAVTAACAANALTALREGLATDASNFGQSAIGLLDRHGYAVPLFLLRQTADAALTSGDGDAGEALLTRAARQAEAEANQETGTLDWARVIAEQGRRLVTRGEMDQGKELLEQASQLFTAEGSESEAVTVIGDIADVAFRRGDYDEALRIRREVELPVYERLGDVRETALAWNKMANVAFQRGEHDEAAEMQHRCLELNEQLGHLEGIAAANWELARIDLIRNQQQAAGARMVKSFQIFLRLQRPDGIAAVGMALAQLLIAGDAAGPASQVLEVSRAAAVKLGRTDVVQEINEMLNSLPPESEGT